MVLWRSENARQGAIAGNVSKVRAPEGLLFGYRCLIREHKSVTQLIQQDPLELGTTDIFAEHLINPDIFLGQRHPQF